LPARGPGWEKAESPFEKWFPTADAYEGRRGGGECSRRGLGGADSDSVSVMPADFAISMIDVGLGRGTTIGCMRNQFARTCLA
jgi:hypothetical protein